MSEGIEYAYQNGATILNMSFGGYAESQTEQGWRMHMPLHSWHQQEMTEYIGPGILCARMFPAAWTYVIGVEAGTEWSTLTRMDPSSQDNLT